MSTHSPFQEHFEGILLPKDAFVVIIRTEWNGSIVNELEHGCVSLLDKHNVSYKIIHAPGAFEIPFTANHCFEAATRKPNAIIALGCVIRGDTPHFDYVCKAVTDGILQLNLKLPVPTIFGILTVDNEAQAKARLGGEHGHKGEEAAMTAIKMISMVSKSTNF